MSGQEMHLNQLSSRSKAPSSHSIIIQYGATILTEFKLKNLQKQIREFWLQKFTRIYEMNRIPIYEFCLVLQLHISVK